MAFLQTTVVDAKLDRSEDVPMGIMNQGLISDTNHAYTCFVKQRFSADLQAYLVSYVISVTAYQSIYK
jgi:hypothetical protein